jgi:hypothetical protein
MKCLSDFLEFVACGLNWRCPVFQTNGIIFQNIAYFFREYSGVEIGMIQSEIIEILCIKLANLIEKKISTVGMLMLVTGVAARLKRVGMKYKCSVGKLMRMQKQSFVQDQEAHRPENKESKNFLRNISTEVKNHVAKVGMTPIPEIPTNGDIAAKSFLFNLKDYLKTGTETEYSDDFLIVFGNGERAGLSFQN